MMMDVGHPVVVVVVVAFHAPLEDSKKLYLEDKGGTR